MSKNVDDGILEDFLNNIRITQETPVDGKEIKLADIGEEKYIIKIRHFNELFNKMVLKYSKVLSKFRDTYLLQKLNSFLVDAKINSSKYTAISDFISQLESLKTKQFNYLFKLYNVDLDSDCIELGNFELYKPSCFFEKYTHLSPQTTLYRAPEEGRVTEDNYLHSLLLLKNINIYEDDEEYLLQKKLNDFLSVLFLDLGRTEICGYVSTDFDQIISDRAKFDSDMQYFGGSFSASKSIYTKGNVILSKEGYEQRQIKLFNLIDGDNSQIEEKLFQSIKWISKSLLSDNFEDGFLQLSIAAESLIYNGNKYDNISETIADVVAFLLGENKEDRIRIFKDIKNLYNIRSNLVHRGNEIITYASYYQFFIYLRDVIHKILLLISEKGINTADDLLKYIKDIKYSYFE